MERFWIPTFVFVVGLALSFMVRSCYYENEYDKAKQRAEEAEKTVITLKESQEKLTLALEDQQRATQEAQSQTKVVYKTIQKEVAKDATARDWYHTAVPESLVRVLKANAGAN